MSNTSPRSRRLKDAGSLQSNWIECAIITVIVGGILYLAVGGGMSKGLEPLGLWAPPVTGFVAGFVAGWLSDTQARMNVFYVSATVLILLYAVVTDSGALTFIFATVLGAQWGYNLMFRSSWWQNYLLKTDRKGQLREIEARAKQKRALDREKKKAKKAKKAGVQQTEETYVADPRFLMSEVHELGKAHGIAPVDEVATLSTPEYFEALDAWIGHPMPSLAMVLDSLNRIGKRGRHGLIFERGQRRLDFFGSAETGVVVFYLESPESDNWRVALRSDVSEVDPQSTSSVFFAKGFALEVPSAVTLDMDQAAQIAQVMFETGSVPEECVWVSGVEWHPPEIELS